MKKQWKGFLGGFLSAVLIMALCIPAFAATVKQLNATYKDIKIILNGEEFVPKTPGGSVIEPFIVGSTTYLPLRSVAEAAGFDVGWDGSTNTITLTKNAEDRQSPFVLGLGLYVVGEDIAPGKYNCRAVSGSGNFMGNVSSLTLGMLNTLLSAPSDTGAEFGWKSTYEGLRLKTGDTIEIMGTLEVEFIKES